jgi:heme A synthase
MTRFERLAWAFLAYLLFVILFGAWVRISGSGDGCGNHWPLCRGEVVPVAPATKTIIEFSHRLSSGFSGIIAIVLVWWARRVNAKVFRASLAMFVFLMLEAFIGAVLVKKQLVAGDASTSRAIVIALHLCNTMLLTASAAAMAWWAGPPRETRGPAVSKALLAAMVVLLIATNATGAVTALGDTLFPVQPGLPTPDHFLAQLRIVHPIVAMTSVLFVGAALLWLMQSSPLRLLKSSLHALAGQAALGFLNIALSAPPWMQILHLLAAQVVWILIFLSVLTVWGGQSWQQPPYRRA